MIQNRPTNLFYSLLPLFVLLVSVTAHAQNGVMLDIIVHETLAADPPETTIVDSVEYPVFFNRLTTVRAGNFIADVTVTPVANGSFDLTANVLVSGPLPATKSDRVTVLPGAALVVDGIRGKGKSSYRAIFSLQLAELPHDTLATGEDSAIWQDVLSLRARYLLPTGVLPPLQFMPVRGILDYEFEGILDTFDIVPSERLDVYLATKPHGGWPYVPGQEYAVDESRFRVIAAHSPFHPQVRTKTLLLAAYYRAWGYAPLLLASGVAGYPDFSDYKVKLDHAAGRRIPLDSLAQSMDYRRHDLVVADNHAESFVAWLLNTYGIPRFRDVYERSTDLSIHRAFWAVYGRTIAELEVDWLAYLSKRQFYREEFDYFAKREAIFRRYESHLTYLKEAAALESAHKQDILRDIGTANGQLGRWTDAVTALEQLINEYPQEKQGRWLLAEAQRAAGDDDAAARTYEALFRTDPNDVQTFLRMGDIQWERRRVDSAAFLWRQGLAARPGPISEGELCLRLGQYFAERRHGRDSALTYFDRAKAAVAGAIMNSPTNPAPWAITAEALLGKDSAVAALEHLAVAREATDSPIDLGRIHLLRGKCFDKLNRRSDAIMEYEATISGNADAPTMRLARKYLNRAYGR